MKRLQIALLLALSLIGCQPEILITHGVTEELAKQRKSAISELFYDLIFRIPELKTEKVSGSATIRFNLKNANQHVQLDFKGDTTANYTLICNGKTSVIRIQKDHLVIDHSLLMRGKNEIQLNFTCPDWSLNRNPEFLYTLFVPDRASTAFPCFDQPDLKASFTLHLEIPAEWKAVANSSIASQEIKDSVKSISFCPSQPLPSYLFSFVAGNFETVSRTNNNKTYTLYHREKEEAILRNNVDSIFSLLFQSINQIEQYTAIGYPFEKYDLVAIPSFQYNGMEHPGATLYRASSLFLDAKPTRQQLLKRANLIAHETAHMWFGDLVTMSWFDEVWLKEVFANFIADKVTAPIFPEFNFDLLFLMAHYEAAYSVDRTSGANAIGQKLANMKDAGSLYGSIIYHKAPIVMKMLEKKTGEEVLRNGLRQYLNQYAYGNAGWKELIDILNTKKTDELTKWSDSWVNEAGRPQIKSLVDGKNLIIEQSDPFGESRIWTQELEITSSVNGSNSSRQIVFNTEKLILENIFPQGKPDWIYLNAKGNVYGYVEIDSVSQTYFTKNFSLLNDDLLRASVLNDLNENLHEGNLNLERFLEMLINSIQAEQNPVIYEGLLTNLETCFLYKTTDEQRLKFAGKLEDVLWKEHSIRTAQKTAIVNSLIKLAGTERSLDKLSDLLAGKYSGDEWFLSADQKNELALQLALKRPEKATEILDKQEKQNTNPDKKEWFQFVRKSVNPDQTERNRFFRQLLDAKNREHEPWADQSMAFLNHPLRQKESLDYIRPALEKLQEIQQTGDIFFPKSWLDNLLKGHNSKEAATIVKQFLKDHPDYPENLKMKILQSADHLMRR